MKPKTKFKKSFIRSSLLSLTFSIQYNDQKTVLESMMMTPFVFENFSWKILPLVAIIIAPVKLIIIAKMLLMFIFCFNKGIDNKTRVMGQVKFNTTASCVRSIEYPLNRKI